MLILQDLAFFSMDGEMISSHVDQPFRFRSTDCAHESIAQQVLETVVLVVVDHIARRFIGNDGNITGINSGHMYIGN